MVAKKKSAKPAQIIDEKEEFVSEGVPQEDRRPPVTQVVEVVEDGDESTHTAVAEPVVSSDTLEDAPLEEELPQREPPADEEKRRVLVDELFQKKTEQSTNVMPEISVHHTSSRKPIIMWAIILIVASLVAGGIIFAVSGGTVSLPSIGATPTPTPTSTPSPTPTPDVSKLDRSSLSVQVLNGSGVVGAAGKMKDVLEEKGYSVDNTGNAEAYEFESTQILVKPESEAFLALLEEDLKESYSLGTSEATLESDVPYDVRIIVGKE